MIFRIFISLTLCLVALSSSGQVTFNKIYGTDYREDGYQVITSSQDEYVLCGNTFGFGANGEIFLLRVDEYGNQQGFNKFFGVSVDHARYVAERNTGGFLISGMTASYGLGTSSAFIIATDDFGNFDWAKTYGGSEGTIVRQMMVDDNGDIHLVIQASDNTSIHLIKIDDDGNVIQSGGFTSNYEEDLTYATYTVNASLTADNGILLVAERGSYKGMVAVKLDSDYSFEWANNLFVGSSNVLPMAVITKPDNGVVIYGEFSSGFGNSKDVFLVELDSFGATTWGMRYGGLFEETSTAAISTLDGGYCMTGHTISTGNGSHDYFLINVDSVGVPQWSYSYGRPWSDKPYGLTRGVDEGYVIAGISSTESTNIDSTEVYLVKTDANGLTDCFYNSWSVLSEPIDEIDQTYRVYYETEASGMQNEVVPALSAVVNERTYCGFDFVSVEEHETSVNVFPNPARDNVNIALTTSGWSHIELIDSRGVQVKSIVANNEQNLILQRNNLPVGLYVLRIHYPDKEPLTTRVIFQ